MEGLASSSLKRLTSSVLEAMKVLASLNAFCTASAAASEFCSVALASRRGSTSIPLRKGSSASLTFSNDVSTSSVFLMACFMYVSLETRSRWLRVRFLTLSTLSCDFFARARSLLREAFRAGMALGMCASMECITEVSAPCAASTAASIFWIVASVGLLSPTGVASVSTFATSSSADLIFSSSSRSTCLALMRRSPVDAVFLSFVSSCCVVFRRCWSLDSSEISEASFASFCFEDRTFLASMQAVLASFSATTVCSHVDFRLSVETSLRFSDVKSLATSLSVWTCVSASATASTTSCSREDVFRELVSFLKSRSRFCRPSARVCSSESSSTMRLPTPLE
mmetsp:Transcript_35079/g.100744  ORF Transcript_35079/g.100744 Transcript_35079/m.100744 type:complete len:339 (-) Transcript_35079:1705-2721(-)